MKKNVVVGLVGMGVGGSGVARVIYEKSTQLENLVGKPILLKKILKLSQLKITIMHLIIRLHIHINHLQSLRL